VMFAFSFFLLASLVSANNIPVENNVLILDDTNFDEAIAVSTCHVAKSVLHRIPLRQMIFYLWSFMPPGVVIARNLPLSGIKPLPLSLLMK
jgi:hypothetical protein